MKFSIITDFHRFLQTTLRNFLSNLYTQYRLYYRKKKKQPKHAKNDFLINHNHSKRTHCEREQIYDYSRFDRFSMERCCSPWKQIIGSARTVNGETNNHAVLRFSKVAPPLAKIGNSVRVQNSDRIFHRISLSLSSLGWKLKSKRFYNSLLPLCPRLHFL